jgi:hypothetical protein
MNKDKITKIKCPICNVHLTTLTNIEKYHVDFLAEKIYQEYCAIPVDKRDCQHLTYPAICRILVRAIEITKS